MNNIFKAPMSGKYRIDVKLLKENDQISVKENNTFPILTSFLKNQYDGTYYIYHTSEVRYFNAGETLVLLPDFHTTISRL